MTDEKQDNQTAPQVNLYDALSLVERDTLVVLNFIKYNLYLNAKATIAAALISQGASGDDAVAETERLIASLDKPKAGK